MDRRSPSLALGFSCLGHTYMHVLTALYLTVVLGLERDWGLSYDTLIRLWTVGSLLIGLGAPLAGWLGDRWSESRMMVAFFLITGAGSIAAGLADGPAALTAGLAVLGLGGSIYHPVGMSWTVRNALNRGRALGIQGIFGSLGVATAAVIAATLTELIHWRAAFLLPGAVCFATGMALWLCVAAGWVGDRTGDRRPEPPPARGDMVRTFLVLTVTMAVGGLLFGALQVSMPKWFEERMTGLLGGRGVLEVGGLVTLVYLLAAGSQLVGGHLADRVPLKTLYVGGLLVQAPLLVLASTLADVPLLLVAAMAVFVGGGLLPVENLLLARYTPGRYRGLAYGAKFVLAFGVGPLAVQLVAFTYAASGGFALLLWTLGGFGLVAWIAAMLLPGEARRPTPAEGMAAGAGAPAAE